MYIFFFSLSFLIKNLLIKWKRRQKQNEQNLKKEGGTSVSALKRVRDSEKTKREFNILKKHF